MGKGEKKEEVTFYKFLSNINDFLSKLKEKPIQAQPSNFLKDNDFDKEKLIRILIKRKIIKRKESIKDSTNSDEKVAKYFVKYTIIRENFEDKIRELYKDYFSKEILSECDCGDLGGSTSCGSVDAQYTVPFPGLMVRPSYLNTRKKKNNKEPKPENILGKTIQSENMKRRRVYLSESQMEYILEKCRISETTTCGSVGGETTRGDVGYDAPAFIDDETADRTPGKICMNRLDKNGKIK